MTVCACETVRKTCGPPTSTRYKYLTSLAVAPREEAVVEGGGGAKHVGGVGRHDGGREGGGVVVVD